MTIENAVSHIGALETGLDGDARHGAGSRRDRAQIATHAIGIVGMSDAEADRLFAEFYWYMLQPNAEYRHKWQKGDIVLWDNRCPCIRRLFRRRAAHPLAHDEHAVSALDEKRTAASR